MGKREQRKLLEEKMRERAFELRQMTGRGHTRDQLMLDPTWKELNDKLKAL